MITSAHIQSPKMKLHAIVVLWLGVQAPTEEVHVVLEVPPEVDEGMCIVTSMHFHLTTAATYHLASP